MTTSGTTKVHPYTSTHSYWFEMAMDDIITSFGTLLSIRRVSRQNAVKREEED